MVKIFQKFPSLLMELKLRAFPQYFYKVSHPLDININKNISILILISHVLAKLPNGIEVWWDGVTRVYIDLPATFKQKTKVYMMIIYEACFLINYRFNIKKTNKF